MNWYIHISEEPKPSYFHEFILMMSVALSFAFIGAGELFSSINLVLMCYVIFTQSWRNLPLNLFVKQS